MSTFLRLVGTPSKGERLTKLLTEDSPAERFDVESSELSALPGSPFAYWVSETVRQQFREHPSLQDGERSVKFGLSTRNDFRFVRVWWEVAERVPWPPLVTGGRFSRHYRRYNGVVWWDRDGWEIYAHNGIPFGGAGAPMRNPDSYFQPGITWPLRGIDFSTQFVPEGCIFTGGGKMAFASDRRSILELGAVTNSVVFNALLVLFAGKVGGVQYEVGLIGRVPVPDLEPGSSEQLATLARNGWSLQRSLDTISEVSHAFVVPAALQVEGGSFGERVAGWAVRVAGVEAELESVQFEIDELCFGLYGISEEDRRAITEGFGITDESSADEGSGDESDDADHVAVDVDPVGLAASLVLWCVGVATGRFDVRLATGERSWPEEPDPFDALPVCSPGMLTGDDGLPLTELPSEYPLDPSPVLVVDPGHRLDVTARVREVFDVVFGDNADSWWSDVGEVLDPRSGELESWLGKGFFEHHLKTYSKSRRKAPVIWPIGTASGSYQVWLYAHRVTGDSLFRVLNDLIVPKLNAEESKLTRLRQEAGLNPSASERRAIDAQEKCVSELVALREVVEEVAPLWAPDLNDGIVIVLAPLWSLFPHHKPWMRELKKHWDKLAKGDYDWAQLAMHLWPERVIPKCADDRSLAIAHGLEEVFWEPDPDNDDRWIPRNTPTTPINQLITNRHNPTIKTALATMGSA